MSCNASISNSDISERQLLAAGYDCQHATDVRISRKLPFGSSLSTIYGRGTVNMVR